MSLERINSLSALKSLLVREKEIKLYGAGHYLNLFLQGTEAMDRECTEKVTCILVTDTEKNPKQVKGIPVRYYRDTYIKSGDCIILTLGHRYTAEIYEQLKNTRACMFELDFDIFQREPYEEIRKIFQPFMNKFPMGILDLNEPVYEGETKVWSCWWQGEAQAPELVKACWESQKMYLPVGTKHVIITEENYKEYIVLPEYILSKVRSGHITLTHLSDIIRVTLLYKYGGLWLDGAALVLEPLPKDILDYPIYTRNLPEVQYCSDAMWTIGFMYARAGNKLFHFLSEGFFWYFSLYDQLNYYFTLDYMIAIACNTFPEIESQLKQIPYNNENAFELRRHLKDPFTERNYKKYVQGTCVQLLTYKLDWTGEMQENTVYNYIIKKYS